jgi:hypothetical protein
MPRGPQWHEREDVALTRAFLAITEDPIVGDQQKSDVFWTRVLRRHGEKCPGTKRTLLGVKSRWKDHINPDVSGVMLKSSYKTPQEKFKNKLFLIQNLSLHHPKNTPPSHSVTNRSDYHLIILQQIH